MDPQKQREIASKGGKAAHEKGTAHEFTSEEARVAGKKGGAASRIRRGKGENGSDQESAAITPTASQSGADQAAEPGGDSGSNEYVGGG